MEASTVVSSHVDEGNCSSSDGTEVSSGGAGGGDSGNTKAAGTAGVTGEGSSSWSWEAGGPEWSATITEGEVA